MKQDVAKLVLQLAKLESRDNEYKNLYLASLKAMVIAYRYYDIKCIIRINPIHDSYLIDVEIKD